MKRFFCGLLLVGLFSGADAPPAVYVLSQGETFAEIAKKTLGDAAAVTELQHFNKWRSLPAPKAGMRIAIPGVEREAAITALGLAKIEIDAAKAVGAETYAAAELATARATLVRANATRSHGGYTHATNQAKQAVYEAGIAQFQANERACIQEDAIASWLTGVVSTRSDDGSEPVRSGQRIVSSRFIETEGGAAIDITTPGQDLIRVLEGSSLFVKSIFRDQRDNRRWLRLQLAEGRIDGQFSRQENVASAVTIETDQMIGKVHLPAHIQLRTDPLRKMTWLSVWQGSVTLKDGIVVAAGEGVVFGHRGRFSSHAHRLGPIPLMNAPALNSPGETTARHWLSLAWGANKRASHYQVEVARGPAFRTYLQNVMTVGTESTVGAIENHQTVNWRLTAFDTHGLSSYPSTGTIRVQPDLVVAFVVTGHDEAAILANESQAYLVGERHTIAVGPQAADTSVIGVEVSLDGGPFEYVDTLCIGHAGAHAVRARGIGAQGQVGPETAIQVQVDHVAPAVGAEVTERTSKFGETRVSIAISATDDSGVAGIEYQLNDRDFRPYDGPIEKALLKRTLLKYRATDSVGNRSIIYSLPLR
ncbi:MAG TPA: hypothetical protein DCR55_16680 [Lentisphaeria bacterium]|jgi:hypothetical protein|nr:hypothetical protein [Lentisphaeria bacterium]